MIWEEDKTLRPAHADPLFTSDWTLNNDSNLIQFTNKNSTTSTITIPAYKATFSTNYTIRVLAVLADATSLAGAAKF